MTWLFHIWRDSFTCDLTHLVCNPVTLALSSVSPLWYDSFICDMTHSYVTCLIRTRYDSFICNVNRPCETWLIHTRDMTHSYLTWLIHACRNLLIRDMTHSFVTSLIHMWHDSFKWHTQHMISRRHLKDVYKESCNVNHRCETWLMTHSA